MFIISAADDIDELLPDGTEALECETCGNLYSRPIQVISQGNTHTFDCFECAIAALAPICTGCQCRVIGHGVESDGMMFCGTHCARKGRAR